jgi:hypothetical protein
VEFQNLSVGRRYRDKKVKERMKLNLELKIDVNADIQNAKSFVNYGEFVDCFLPPELQHIISEKLSNEERDEILTEYTKHIYEKERDGIEKGV